MILYSLIALIYFPIVARITHSLLLDFSMGIRTMGYIGPSFKGFNRTESTPYSAIISISRQLNLKKEDSLVDFGCGKGRFMLGINKYTSINVTGVEGGEKAYKRLKKNVDKYTKKTGKSNLSIVHGLAQEYEFSEHDNKFFFFNPFDVATFEEVLNNIVKHSKKNEIEVEVILYAPSKKLHEHIKRSEFKFNQKIKHYGKIFPSEGIYIYTFK